MEVNSTKLTERILQLTLEIIYLLTGEDDIAIISKKTAKDGQNPVMVPLQSLPITPRNNKQKILEVSKKMVELLMGESGNWSNFKFRIKEEIKEEEEAWEYFEGYKDFHKDYMMASQPILTSPDGSSNGNPPERCPRPLYSWDSTQEDLTVPRYQQGKDVFEIKSEIKEEKEEMYVGENQLSMMKAKITGKEESTLDDFTEGHRIGNTSDGGLTLSDVYIKEEENAGYPPGVIIVTLNGHSDLNDMERSKDEFNSKELKDKSNTIIPNIQPSFQYVDRPEVPCNPEESSSSGDLFILKKINTKVKPFSCPECGKTFVKKSNLVHHYRVHTGEKPFSCSECGKSYSSKGNRDKHMRIHTGEKPFSCSECGKAFSRKEKCDNHIRTHTGEKPFSCSECGKYFSSKEGRHHHMKIHIGEKPFSCSECGKGFSRKEYHDKHMRIHIGEKPFCCSECGKGFSWKECLDKHMRIHTGEKPFFCSECGKGFSIKANRDKHMRIHTGEKPFSCFVCGKCFPSKRNCDNHMRIHIGEKPFSEAIISLVKAPVIRT